MGLDQATRLALGVAAVGFAVNVAVVVGLVAGRLEYAAVLEVVHWVTTVVLVVLVVRMAGLWLDEEAA